jgi:hypothetical protein
MEEWGPQPGPILVLVAPMDFVEIARETPDFGQKSGRKWQF